MTWGTLTECQPDAH